MFRYLMKPVVVLTTLLIFVLFWLISLVPFQKITELNPISDALADFELTDVVFSKFQDPNETPIDTNIVVVNIGRLPRNGVAQVLRNLSKYRPKVVGIDALYRNPKGLEIDTPLSNALRYSPVPVVMVTELADRDPETGKFQKVLRSNEVFSDFAHDGYANITNAEAMRTIREVSPRQIVNGDTAFSFVIALMKHYDPKRAQQCLARNNEQERINWRGHISKFFFIDTPTAVDTTADLSIVKGKIVLMAFVDTGDERTRSLEDLYFTPMNAQYAGKALPDMYGIYIHANLLSTILSDSYVDIMPQWVGVLWAVFLCWLNLGLFTWIYYERKAWFDITVIVGQVALNLIVLYLVIIVFAKYRYEIQVNVIVLVLLLGPNILEIVLPFWERLAPKARERIKQIRERYLLKG